MTAKTDVPAPVVLSVNGDLTQANRHEFKARVLAALESGQRRIVVDCTDAYIDSAGLGVLLTATKKVSDAGGALVLANLTPDMRTLFEVTKLGELFSFADSVARAIEYLEKGA